MKLTRIISLLTAAVFIFSAAALARPNVKLVLSQTLVTQVNGKTTFSAVPSEGAKRGSTLRYTIVASNTGDAPALQFEPVGNVPSGATYLAGTASTNAPLQYTLDKKTWSTQPMIEVKLPNGKTVKRPADPSTYAAVRWTVAKVPPKKPMSFTYEVRIK
ncbi:MAG TPA: hypothetical protein VMS32_04760 [Verrucomicrobiae bacterium]|jgi:uncharacterized repeat protein (TIGR01451 family)|nr:hypothetical protein [Verrucomicrobiae bacterium]